MGRLSSAGDFPRHLAKTMDDRIDHSSADYRQPSSQNKLYERNIGPDSFGTTIEKLAEDLGGVPEGLGGGLLVSARTSAFADCAEARPPRRRNIIMVQYISTS
ncbi:uncharacterized protein LOC144201842 [Stigmatopora nigra]